MNKQDTLRRKYGLNQQQMAEWLGISRSMVAHHERSTRNLPSQASSKHSRLLIMMAKMEAAAIKTGNKRKPDPETTVRLDKLKWELDYQSKGAAHRAEKMKEKLVIIQKQYEQSKNLIELVEKMLKTVTKEKDEGSFLWLQVQDINAKERLKKCDEVVQLQMRARIKILEMTSRVMNYEL